MSGVTYGHPGANGGEYVFVAPNGQQMAYAQPGQGVGIPGAMPPQLVQQQSAGTYMTTGGPSMRKTVEGIPQIHVQQQLAQQQQQQQHTVQQTPSMVGGGVPMATAHSVPLLQHHFPVQTGPPAQAYPPGVGVPLEYYQTALHPQQTVGFPHLTATHVPDFRFGGPQYVVESNWHGEGEWDGEYEENGGAVLYGNLEVKHRRRTTPEQLRVLEHYFSINPRPDNQLREFLAGELGITKRNVQVWFQNRRAKIKNQEKAREAAAQEAKNKEAAAAAAAVTANSSDSTAGTKTEPATPEEVNNSISSLPSHQLPVTPSGRSHVSVPSVSAQSTPTRPTSSSGAQRHLNPTLSVDKVAMGRRVSLAGGDVASIETWARQRRQQLATTLNTSSSASPANSPMGMAAAARRSSQPYPTQIITHHEDIVTPSRSALPSPKVSPNGRMPQQLLLTAMRNNTMRRASMPGGAQLISVTTFTPPRTINTHPVGSNSTRELSPIKDQDHDSDIDPALRTSGAGVGVFVTPPGIDQSLLNMQHDSQLQYQLNPSDMPFSPNSPLPNPGFTFGGTPSGPINNDNSVYTSMSTTPVLSNSTVDPNHALFMALQRGRLASLASVHSVASNATDATSTCDGSDGDWAPLNPPGFDPDLRRASAPADLLHNIGLLGISSAGSQAMSQVSSANSTQSMTMRPSPLASYNQGYDQQHMQMTSSTPTLGGGPYIPTHETSPSTVTGSNAPSEGPSPSALHSHTTMFGGPTLMPPPPLPQRQTYTTLPQFELEAVPDLPEPSAYTLPSEGNDSLSDFDLGFDFSSDDKDQFSFLADLSGGDDPINVIV